MADVQTPLQCYLVEWYRPELDEAQLADIVADVDRCAVSLTAAGTPVRCLYTLAVPTDEVVFAVFSAGSAEAVARVCQRAGLPLSRLSAAVAERNRGPEMTGASVEQTS